MTTTAVRVTGCRNGIGEERLGIGNAVDGISMMAALQLMRQFWIGNQRCLDAVHSCGQITNLETRMEAQGGDGGTRTCAWASGASTSPSRRSSPAW